MHEAKDRQHHFKETLSLQANKSIWESLATTLRVRGSGGP